jgi:protein tyrosine phosphatase
MTTSTHGARRGNKATNKRQQQHKLKSGSRKRHSHYKLLTQKQQLGGVITREHRGAIRRPPPSNSKKPQEGPLIKDDNGNRNWSGPNPDYPTVEYPPSPSVHTTPENKSTTQSTSPEVEQIVEEPIYGTLGAPRETPRWSPHVKRNSSPRSRVTPHRTTAPKPSMQPAAGEQPKNSDSGENWEVPNSLNDKYSNIPMDKDNKVTQTERIYINSDRKPLNRYATQILPYVDNTLQVKGVDYINASPITLKVGDGPQLSYIATQCPTVASFPNFWKMIFQYKVPVICMVTNLVEGGARKCDQYYPEGDHKQVIHGNITITCMSETTISDAIIERIFTVKKDDQEHKVTHLHYTVWPDLDYPPIDTDRAQLITLSNEISKACNGGTAPPVIHCSAGVGRTGSIIAINYLMHIPKEIRDTGLKNEDNSNMLLQIITQLRQQRLWMVQKPTQFVGIIRTVLDANSVDNQLWTGDIKSTPSHKKPT